MTSLTEEQKLAIETVDFNVLVSAGAGSGKTHVLVERYLEVLKRNDDLTVTNLVAVTFTTKAANEMRCRLKARMQELVQASSGAARQRWSQALAAVDGARIGTIHGLCESILKSFPTEANIDPHFEVLSELERAELLDLCLEQALHEAAASEGEDSAVLLTYPIDEIKSWLGLLLSSQLQFQEGKESLPGLEDCDLENHGTALLARQHTEALSRVIDSEDWRQLVTFLEDNVWQKGGLLEQHRINILGWCRAAMLPSGADDLPEVAVRERLISLKVVEEARVGTAGGANQEAGQLRSAIRDLKGLIKSETKDLPLSLCEADRQTYKLIRGIVHLSERALTFFVEAKKSGMRLDFNDMILYALRVLSTPGSVARRFFHENIKAILVDEFQDTNRFQAEIIYLLAGDATRLFLIGDDKQSIYKFQGADVSIFNQWRGYFSENRLREGGCTAEETKRDRDCSIKLSGESLLVNLTRSFRSHPDIVFFVNTIFQQLMGEQNKKSAYNARFQALEAARTRDEVKDKLVDTADSDERIDVTLFEAIEDGGRRESEAVKRLEGAAVAGWIAEKVVSGVWVFDKESCLSRAIQYGDFAILVQKNAEFRVFEEVLSQWEIPYVTLAASGFLDRQEIYDVENVLRFLWCPVDDQSLVGVLRSPMFGVSDDVLHRLCAGRTGTLWSSARQFCRASSDECPELARAVLLLQSLIRFASENTLGAVVRKIIHDTKYDIILLALPAGKQRARNIWKLAHLAGKEEKRSLGDFVSMLDQMRTLKVKQSNAPLDSGNSVKLMTVHGSKGLEFSAVALPCLSGHLFGRPRKLLFHRDYGIAFDSTRDRADPKPSLFLACRRLEREMEEAERKRLLYVAMTRAREYLGIFMEETDKNGPSFRAWLNSSLRLENLDSSTGTDVEYLTGKGGSVAYKVKTVDQRRVYTLRKQLCSQPVSSALLDTSDPLGVCRVGEGQNVDLELIAPLVIGDAPAQLNLPVSVRITAAKTDATISPTVVGNLFHAIMQHLPADMAMPSQEFITDLALASATGLIDRKNVESLIGEVEVLLERFKKSKLFDLMAFARRRIHEAPYLIVPVNGMPQAPERGRTDLLLQDADGNWWVVDYKTDHFAYSAIEEHVNAHRQQLESYVQHIRQLTGVESRAALYFAVHGVLSELPLDRSKLLAGM